MPSEDQPSDNQPTQDNRNLPVPVHNGEVLRPAPERWLMRAIRSLFGWKAGSVRRRPSGAVLDASTPDEASFTAIERAMLRNILSLHERRIADVMVTAPISSRSSATFRSAN